MTTFLVEVDTAMLLKADAITSEQKSGMKSKEGQNHENNDVIHARKLLTIE